MGFQVSPGVNVTEKDLTNLVPSVATTTGAFCGYFRWGPAEEIVQVDSERNLLDLFGGPTNLNSQYWFSAANFLGYGNDLRVVRKYNTSAANAVGGQYKAQGGAFSIPAGRSSGIQVKNEEHYESLISILGTSGPDESNAGISAGAMFVGKYAGELGNSLLVSMSDQKADLTFGSAGGGVTGFTAGSPGAGGVASTFTNQDGTAVVAGCLEIDELDGPALRKEVAVGDTIKLSGSDTTYTVLGFSGGTTSDSSMGVSAAHRGLQPETLGNHFNEEGAYTHIFLDRNLDSSDEGVITTATVQWTYQGNFDKFPGTSTQASDVYNIHDDEVQIAVIDEDGLWSGTRGTLLEKFTASKARDAKKFDGSSNYYVNVVNNESKYVWWGDHPDLTRVGGTSGGINTGRPWGDDFAAIAADDGTDSGSGATFESLVRNMYMPLVGGADKGVGEDLHSETNNNALYTNGYDLFADAETQSDIALVVGGPAYSTLAGKLIDLADARKDCVTFLSPLKSDCVNTNAITTKTDAVVNYFNNTLNKSSSYGVFDSGWKYQYDGFNDVFRWVPLNGDVAGLCARTEFTNDAWFSPAGFNRGQIRNVTKLAINPRKAHRDKLYKNGINPVVAFPGEGTVLFGDKTMQSKPSAFDRINVRRLFIVLEKAIATAAKFFLFEFNDQFTRAQFVSTVAPFLREVQGRRGITDFRVVCDETNNPGDVIDRNEFVADIFIKPARSINFIQLNFVAVRTDVTFEEVLGA
jgi:hypothetical protein